MHPVVALKGAPAKFPIAASNRNIQRHFIWSDAIEREIKEKFTAERPFVGIHLRNGQDWVRNLSLSHYQMLTFNVILFFTGKLL